VAVIELKSRPSPRDLFWFGWILLAFFAIVGGVAWLRFDAHAAAAGLWTVGAALTAMYFAVRPLRVPFYLGWMRLFFPLGWTVSHVALAVLYFGVVTPIAFLLRRVGYDPMGRRRDRAATTYWTEHRTGGSPSRYLRQF
jgi:hypothetical protein